MNTDQLLDYYQEAVKGIDENLLKNEQDWCNYVLSLPRHLQVVYTILIFHQQVYNGGLHQYFYNGYGLFVFETIRNLKSVGANQTEEILRSALEAVNVEKLSEGEFRKKSFNREHDRINSFDKPLGKFLDDLDKKYYSQKEDVHQLLVNFLERGNYNWM
jgi:hypothetical protein